MAVAVFQARRLRRVAVPRVPLHPSARAESTGLRGKNGRQGHRRDGEMRLRKAGRTLIGLEELAPMPKRATCRRSPPCTPARFANHARWATRVIRSRRGRCGRGGAQVPTPSGLRRMVQKVGGLGAGGGSGQSSSPTRRARGSRGGRRGEDERRARRRERVGGTCSAKIVGASRFVGFTVLVAFCFDFFSRRGVLGGSEGARRTRRSLPCEEQPPATRRHRLAESRCRQPRG